jgi:hypothetical protein
VAERRRADGRLLLVGLALVATFGPLWLAVGPPKWFDSLVTIVWVVGFWGIIALLVFGGAWEAIQERRRRRRSH